MLRPLAHCAGRPKPRAVRAAPRGRRGAAAAEFALFLPLLAVLVLGMFEVGRSIMVKETLTEAARQGCRTAALPSKDNAAITADVNSVLQDQGFNPANAAITVLVNDQEADANTAKRNDKVSVQVSLPVAKVAWVSSFFFLGRQSVVSEVVCMMRQG